MKTSLILFFALGAACLLQAQTPRDISTVPLSEIQIRDPFVLADPSDSTYYLFGTNRPTEGFDGYKSKDMKNWEGPYPLFRKDAEFWGGGNFWAPECHPYKGKYYLFATARGKADSLLGSYILVAESPMGPYREHSNGRVTPEGWNSLDGTLYIDPEGNPWMVFCHEWTQVDDGTIEAVRLSPDLREAAGDPQTLFAASAGPWVRSHVPDGDKFAATGPFLFRNNKGELLMLWSFLSANGCSIGIARSSSGEIQGPWEQVPGPWPLFTQAQRPPFMKYTYNGMLFRTFDGRLQLTAHAPNLTPYERADFSEMKETDDGLLDFEGVVVVGYGKQKKPKYTN